MSPNEVIRAAATTAVLLSEASRYGDISLLMGGWGISSFFWPKLGNGGGLRLGKGERRC